MSRFHFQVHDGASSRDRDGSEVTDLDEARRQALHMAGVLLQEQGLGHAPISPFCVEVTDGQGAALMSVQVGLVYRSTSGRDFEGPSVAVRV